jgi:predicted TIM-barrel fold metal-dependent hydrolase
MKGSVFYDVHCHLMNLSHPAFVSIIESMRHRPREVIYSQLVSFDYLAASILKRGGESVRNLLAVMDNDCADILFLLEDDLAGQFEVPKGTPPFKEAAPLRDGTLHVAGQEFTSLVLTPLVMDFMAPSSYAFNTYYRRTPQKPIDAQINDVMFAIHTYRVKRPGGILRIYPFLGVNTKNYTLEGLAAYLEKWFADYTRDEDEMERRFLAMAEEGPSSAAPRASRNYGLFAGIKLYPPLGFDPWPADPEEREKVEFLYAFAESKGIPITTHCDDQGYRIVSLEEALLYTAPARYRPALKKYPNLTLNFAHMGKRHIRTIGGKEQADWRDDILAFIKEYPNVYTDFSFTAGESSFYGDLSALLRRLEPHEAEKVSRRIMYGSDFMVNLFKVRSYRDYLESFSQGVLDAGLKMLFCTENPRRFLFGE